jgi:hypothetical protein
MAERKGQKRRSGSAGMASGKSKASGSAQGRTSRSTGKGSGGSGGKAQRGSARKTRSGSGGKTGASASKASDSRRSSSSGSSSGKTRASRSTTKAQDRKAQDRKPQERNAGSRESHAGSNNRGSFSALDAADNVREQLQQLLGRPVESVLGVDRDHGNWVVTAQVVELERIPNTTDVLAEYEAVLNSRGEVVRYHRSRRYHRAHTDTGQS